MTGSQTGAEGPLPMPSPWTATVLTLFPEAFPGPLDLSILGRARGQGLWALETLDIRDFARDNHRSVDDTPAGGGPGMVLRPDILADALDAARAGAPANRPVWLMSPRGEPLNQALVREVAEGPGLICLCGRFEGVDERVIEARPVREVSLGDFVLAGGEVAAMAALEAVVRLIPGVTGKAASTEDESFEGGLLEYPHYTRPAVWEGQEIPPVLQSGHHGEIAKWRQAQRERLTEHRRPDLWERYKVNRDRAATDAPTADDPSDG